MIPLLESIYASKGLYQELLGPLCKKYDLTDSELIILLYLEDSNPADTATRIVASQRLKKSVVSVSIDDLEKRGMIESYHEQGDRRTKHLRVMDPAKPVIKEAKKIQERYYDILTDGLSPAEKGQLNEYLKKVNQNISGYSL